MINKICKNEFFFDRRFTLSPAHTPTSGRASCIITYTLPITIEKKKMTNQNQQVSSILGLVKSVNWPMSPKLVNVNDMEIAKAIAKEINRNGDMKDWQIVNVANLIKNSFTIYGGYRYG